MPRSLRAYLWDIEQAGLPLLREQAAELLHEAEEKQQ